MGNPRKGAHTMSCRYFCGNVAASNDGQRGTERVPNDRSESDNVYILPIIGEVNYSGKNVCARAALYSHGQQLT